MLDGGSDRPSSSPNASLNTTAGPSQVYQATDTKLNRDVAIKLLPDAFPPGTCHDLTQKDSMD